MTESGRRRTHRKVRTGCITCKIRRVKCDEEKPACRRCRSTGRRCDGYAFYPAAGGFAPGDQLSYFDGQVTIPMQMRPGGKYTPLEIRGLEFFHSNTIKSLSSFVKTELWSKLLLRLGEHEPAIKHGMIAFSAYHELAASRGFDAVFSGTTGADEFALKQYNIAIGYLWRHLSSGRASRTVSLVACLLFICLEFVRGNRDSALTHLKNGMAMLRLPPSADSMSPSGALSGGFGADVSWTGSCGGEDDVIAPAFARISLVQTMSGQPRQARYMDFLALPDAHPPQSGSFANIDEARHSMLNLVNGAFGFSYMTDNMLLADKTQVDKMQATLLGGITAWQHAFSPYLDTALNADIRGACVIQGTLILTKLWTLRATSPLESAFDEYTADFREMVRLLDYVLSHTSLGTASTWTSRPSSSSPSSTRSPFSPSSPVASEADVLSHTFTVDTGLIANLFFAAVKCRDRDLRRRALSLLRICPRCEGLWDAVESYKVAELIVRVEEEGLPPMPAPDLPEETARVADWDIHRREPGSDRQLVLLSRCRFNTPAEMDLMRAEYVYWES